MHHQQEEPDIVQSVSSEEVCGSGHVQERLPVRASLQLVQDTLPAAGATATSSVATLQTAEDTAPSHPSIPRHAGTIGTAP